MQRAINKILVGIIGNNVRVSPENIVKHAAERQIYHRLVFNEFEDLKINNMRVY